MFYTIKHNNIEIKHYISVCNGIYFYIAAVRIYRWLRERLE